MRVPLYLQDLEPGLGFKRIAKLIKRDWPGPASLSLSDAQEVLARCLGYTDYHDVHRSARACPANASCDSLDGVWAQSMPVISDKLMRDFPSFPLNIVLLYQFVTSWPLLMLTSFRHFHGHTDHRILKATIENRWKSDLEAHWAKLQETADSVRDVAESVQRQLGHHSLGSTLTYLHSKAVRDAGTGIDDETYH